MPSQYANDFFKAITSITSGLMLPLTTADLLAHAIVASVLENLDMDRLINEVGQAVAQRILGANESVDDVARELHERLLLRNESTKKVIFESIYRESEEAAHNVQVFMNAPSLPEARPHLRKFHGTRFTEKYLQSRLQHSSYSYVPHLPPRTPEATRTTFLPSSPPRGPSSPPRKVVQNFGAFSAPANASVFGTAVQSSPFSLAGGKAAFGGMRTTNSSSSAGDDDDDDDDGGSTLGKRRPQIDLREDSISLDQAKRIAMQSAWRNMRA